MMYTYRLILSWSDADQAWIAEVPDLPGAMADGATPQEATANAQVIIAEWIQVTQEEGRVIPAPQHFEMPASA